MGNKLYEENSVQAIANAIRSKLGTDAVFKIGDMATAVSSIPTGITPTGSITLSSNGTYDVGQFGTAVVNVPQYGKPVVPQTGTWQYKSTYPCGFLIIGKDDDVSDSAMFVRMVNGYGFPVTLNSSQQWQNNTINSDVDTEYSTYPEGSKSNFPNGGTINQLNKFVIKENRGEIALHGNGDEKIWDSSNLIDTILDNYYETYTTGGGTKTKEEFKAAIMAKYASTDVSQGATVLDAKRRDLQDALDHWVYSIGLWGGNFDFIIDDINCGSNGAVATNSNKVDIQKNFMGDGTLSNGIYQANPYYIYRDSSGLEPNKIETDILNAYNNRTCIEIFHHYYLDGSSTKWNNFKTALDTLKTYTDQGKIHVVTRKQFYDLGEFVEHYITSVVISPKELTYPKDVELTENDFNIYTVLDNGTTAVCQADKIVDLTNIDYTTVGTYTAYVEYRGFFGNCSVVISNETPVHYLLENYSDSGESLSRLEQFSELETPLQYENGKYYRIQFHITYTASVKNASHTIKFSAPKQGNSIAWRTMITEPAVDTDEGFNEADVIVEFSTNSNATISYFGFISNWLNINSATNWTITNGYIYEIPAPESEGGE